MRSFFGNTVATDALVKAGGVGLSCSYNKAGLVKGTQCEQAGKHTEG